MSSILLFSLFSYASTFSDVKSIFDMRCNKCHLWIDYGVIKMYKDQIMLRAVILKNMPPGNFTGMTEEERNVVKEWIEAGAIK